MGGALKQLPRVSRFSSRHDTFTDSYAREALEAVSGPQVKALVADVLAKWHRPSGDHRLLRESLMHYDQPPVSRCLDGDYLAILKQTCDELRPRYPLVPLTLGAAAKHPGFPRSTSPGFPWVTKGFPTKGSVLDNHDSVAFIHKTWDMIGRGVPWSLPDCMAYYRVVASPREKTKVRPVWGFPVEVILEEARFFLPLLDHLKEHCNATDAYYGLGMETARSGHLHLSRSMAVDGMQVSLAADLSRFDANVADWIIRDVFAHMSDWFCFDKVIDSEGKEWHVNASQTSRRFRALISYFVNTKIRTPDGYRFQKNHGVPSGSMFTNILDTMVNAVQMRVCVRRVTGELPAKDYYYGDDTQAFLQTQINLDDLASSLLTTFGAVLNVDKTILSNRVENIHWLGYFLRNAGPARSLDFILASTLFPEREVETALDSASRLLGQLYSCADPKSAVVFYDCITWLRLKYSISREDLTAYVRTLSSKAMKYLVTLGLTVEDLTVPTCLIDPFGERYIPDVIPRPSPRSFVRLRNRILPTHAFVPESYVNVHMRDTGYKDFYLYTETFSCQPHDFTADRAFFDS